MESIYTLQGVAKCYENRTVLDIDSLEIYRGEILAIVGPSGSGKSTLLRLLNFLEFCDRGKLSYKGMAVQPESLSLSTRRKVTTVFQRPALLAASVETNVVYGLRLRGEHDSRGEIDNVIARMGLSALRRTNARKLSGGEAQRVALARALVIHPDVLLLDEPTANLDPYNVGLIEEVIGETNRTQSATIVLVTHNVFQAHRLASRVGLLLNGKIVEICKAQQFFEQPADPRTRAFVRGEMVY